ncbi:hypothetical protein KC19_10G048200 [Ceratodon purpureus]|uniref:Cytochrome P450 n=1 Tax=Ceratodon purpureus TaxID=3225 RepID=A0A8T0GJJ7_CERPU|nr:hypothetical protein KC19_10G048200 [Ceratodon purpureus]
MTGLIETSAALIDWQKLSYGTAVSALLIVVLLTELLLYVRHARVRAQQRKDLPPGPWPWPIVGNLPAVANGNLQQLVAKFGPLMSLRLGSMPCVVVSTAEAVKELVRANDERLSDRPETLSFRIITDYKTIATAPSPGKLWHKLRSFSAKELLSSKRVASYEGTRRDELSNMMHVLLEASDKGEALNVKQWLFKTVANSMTRMLVNKRIYHGNETNSYKEEVKEEFNRWLQDRKRYALAHLISDFVPWLRFFSETVQGWRPRLEAFVDRQTVLGVKLLELEKHRERGVEKEADSSYVPDFVDVMLKTPITDGEVLEEEFLIKQAMEFFAAGTETSSTAIEWGLAELVAHPELIKRAREEIDAVVGSDRLVQESDIPQLPFLQAVVKETFRVHSFSPLSIPRISTAPAEAFGYKIPSGTRIVFNLHAIHRDPAVYENPDKFDPDRFLLRHLDVNHLAAFDSFELIPFGVGRRMCPGFNLGNTVVHFILANLIHSYEWSVPPGGKLDMTEAMITFALCLKNPLTLVPKHRDGFPAF